MSWQVTRLKKVLSHLFRQHDRAGLCGLGFRFLSLQSGQHPPRSNSTSWIAALYQRGIKQDGQGNLWGPKEVTIWWWALSQKCSQLGYLQDRAQSQGRRDTLLRGNNTCYCGVFPEVFRRWESSWIALHHLSIGQLQTLARLRFGYQFLSQ